MQNKSKIGSVEDLCRSDVTFSDLLNALEEENLLIRAVHEPDNEITYSRLESDSRRIAPNSVFVCIKGFEADGHLFAHKAAERGAEVLIVQHVLPLSKPQIVVSTSRRANAVLARLFYDNPTSKFKLVGVTGTNGKTTIANISEKILLMNSFSVGLIGTLGYNINGQHFVTERTTPDIIDLHKIFARMVQAGVDIVVMEVSSHALALERVYGLKFAVGLFTNLTQDHLDFHIDLDDYAESKYILFKYIQENKGISILNLDDYYGQKFFDRIKTKKIGISYARSDFKFTVLDQNTRGSSFTFQETDFFTNLIGKFNIFNVAAAIAITQNVAPRISMENIKKALNHIQPVKGRLQRVERFKDFGVYVDYAHTPDALLNVLGTLNSLPHRRLLCVFGCGGDRDKTKRPQMLDEVLAFSDLCIITNDNPRSEKPEMIVNDIVAGITLNQKFWIIRDRRKAIETAISAARPSDIVLIAGKGHETYQEIKGVRSYFDDIEVSASAAELQPEQDQLAYPIDPLQLKILFGYKDLDCEQTCLNYISTDTRTIKDNSVFFALKGENFDGHDYVESILKNDSCWAVVEEDYPTEHPHLIRVKNTLQAYGRLAEKYRFNFGARIIAITGSIGKTTTKEYLTNILSQMAPTLKTSGNENNLIGLPKTIFKLKPEHEYAVLELGTNQFGEIAKLAHIAYPDFGIITSIGPSHLEFLKTVENVFKEKSALFKIEGIRKFFPVDDQHFSRFDGITFGTSCKAIYHLENVRSENGHTEFLVNNLKFSIPTPYKKFSYNALIAIAVCLEMNIPATIVQKGLRIPLHIKNRMEIRSCGKRDLLLDCYNANPDSMKAALTFWGDYKPEKPHIAILGDMLELGAFADKYHLETASQLTKIKYEKLISVGDRSQLFHADAHFLQVEDLLENDLISELPEEAVILLKASRGIHLEKLIKRL